MNFADLEHVFITSKTDFHVSFLRYDIIRLSNSVVTSPQMQLHGPRKTFFGLLTISTLASTKTMDRLCWFTRSWRNVMLCGQANLPRKKLRRCSSCSWTAYCQPLCYRRIIFGGTDLLQLWLSVRRSKALRLMVTRKLLPSAQPFPPRVQVGLGRYCGWFMCVDTDTGYILSIEEMKKPEDNAAALKTLCNIVPSLPVVNCCIYDRACRFYNAAKACKDLKRIKT